MANNKDFKVKNGLDVGSTVTLNAYGTGTNTGLPTQALNVDENGNVVEVDAGVLTFVVHNDTGATLVKGTVVYVSGLNGNTPEVSLARANSSSTMPAYGLVEEDIANTADGTVVTFGSLKGLDVSDFGETGITFSLGDTVYVSSSEAGKLTNVAPTGEANLIQNVGKIERASPTTNMTIKVGGAGRTNATPNLDQGKIFIGNSSNQAVAGSFGTGIDVNASTNEVSIGQAVGTTDSPQFAGLTVDTDTLYVDATGDKVGIGTSAPAQILHLEDSDVNTRLLVENTNSVSPKQASLDLKTTVREHRFISDYDGKFNIYDQTASSSRFTISTGGNVGIGTTAPQNELDVRGDVRIQGTIPEVLFRSPDGSSNQYYIGANISDVVDGGFVIGEGSGVTGGTPRVVIDNTGKVGIGTSAPHELLEIVDRAPILQIRDTNTGITDNKATLRLAESGAGSSTDQYYDVSLDNGNFLIHYGPTPRLKIDRTTGGVSIGTTTILGSGGNSKLSVKSGADYAPAIAIGNDGSAASWARLDFVHDQVSGGTGIFYYDQNANFVMRNDTAGAGVSIAVKDSGGTLNSNALKVSSSGNVGIGTAGAPAVPLDVIGATRTGVDSTHFAQISGLSGALYISHKNGTSDGAILFGGQGGAFAEKMRIASSGNVGIGTSSPAGPIDVVSNANGVAQRIRARSTDEYGLIEFVENDGSTAHGYIGTPAADTLAFFTNGLNERMRIDSSGKVLIDRTTAYGDLTIGTPVLQARARSGQYAAAAFVADATSYVISIGFVNPNGTVGSISTSSSSTSYNTSSDYRLKENVVDLTSAIDRLKLIPVHRFNFIVDPDTTVDGFLAHEVQPHVPEAVTGEKDAVGENGDIIPQGIDQSKLVPLLTAAIKEQQTQIEALEARLAVLEATP